MSNKKSTHKSIIQKIGLAFFVIGFSLFTALLGIDSYQLTPETIVVDNKYHKDAIITAAQQLNVLNKKYSSNFAFVADFKQVLTGAQSHQNQTEIPENVGKWDYKIGDWKIKDYVFTNTKSASNGPVSSNPFLFWMFTIGLSILGGLLYIIPKFLAHEGIKNDHIYHNSLTRGLKLTPRAIFLASAIIGILLYGFYYMKEHLFWPVITIAVAAIITYLVFFVEKQKYNTPTKSASPNITAWMGMFAGTYLIGFYILLYWIPEYITGWVVIADPLSMALSGNPASQWFLYGMLYSIIVCVMGIRMMSKYRHNKYQMVRTASVMFFQTAIAFILPEILVKLNQPYFDFKSIWPLDYDFFFDWNINGLIKSGNLGIFMFVWGTALVIIGVPVITYFFGKRWYCSWVCGCGGLAETMGDPFRQLSDKSLRAWKYERWIIHGVLLSAVIMTAMVLYHYSTGIGKIWIFKIESVKTWYGFLIGAGFSGVIGTGFYPVMGNRVWCRFGCPLAAYLGLVQKFKSRFRITVNGSQCISCGNCSTYCEMGIDVRHYAQRGQDIVRSSCVGCGVCAAVCPRGVLKLENGDEISNRAVDTRVIHISENEVSLLN